MLNDPFETGENYKVMVQAKLEQVLSESSPVLVGKIIRKVLENLILTERVARMKDLEISEMDKRAVIEKEYPDIQEEVDRALGEFIGTILSREGG